MSKELEALQDLSKLVFIYGGVEQYKIIEKALKTLEIIKEKEVVISILIRSNTLDEYNNNPMFVSKLLTQDEFELLKGVLYE